MQIIADFYSYSRPGRASIAQYNLRIIGYIGQALIANKSKKKGPVEKGVKLRDPMSPYKRS